LNKIAIGTSQGRTPTTDAMPRQGKGTSGSEGPGRPDAMPWAEAEQRMRKGGWFWLASVRPNGAPHVMPLFAAWSGSSLFIASKNTTRKSRNLVADGRCVITTDTGDLHLIIEGVAARVVDVDTLHRGADAFRAIYDWPTKVTGDQLDADYGAPTSGGPPYDVFQIVPHKAFGFPTDGESFAPTRWRFNNLPPNVLGIMTR
jgi:Pyridoxamine 5'-phosphate oxidase